MTARNLPGEAGSGPEWEEAVKGRERAPGRGAPSTFCLPPKRHFAGDGTNGRLGVSRRGEREQVARAAAWR